MKKRYSIAEARANLPKLIDAVESGEHVEVTRRGKPVAVIVSERFYEQVRDARPSFASWYREWREKYPKGIDLPDDYWDSLRDKSPGRPVDL
ncbi:MAG: type II toxin-antitoxin system Phd/YefM family antitoxin [Actinomycetota bacterium]